MSAAVRYGHVDVVGLLIEHGANLRARDHNGRTLLMRAARSGNIPIIDQLLQRGELLACAAPSGIETIGFDQYYLSVLLGIGSPYSYGQAFNQTPPHRMLSSLRCGPARP